MDGESPHRGPRSAPHGVDARAPMLVGVKRQDWRGRSEAARGIGRKLAERGEIAYWESSARRAFRPQAKAPICVRTPGSERVCAPLSSSTARTASCPRAGVCDRSRDGLRLALARDVTLPPRLAVHIDETSEVREAKIVWRRGSTIGVRAAGDAPGRRDDGKPKVRAEGTLLRDSQLSRFTHKTFSSTRAELASVLMARLIAARVSFSQ